MPSAELLAFARLDLTRMPVDEILALVRTHLGMDVAFVGKFIEERRILRNVAGEAALLGTSHPMDGTYCRLIADGELEQVVADARAHPLLGGMPVTGALDVRGYAGVPIVLSSGHVYGTLCCYSHEVRDDLTHRDADVLHLLAGVLADRLETEELAALERRAASERVEEILAGVDPAIVYQPVVGVRTGRVIGVEALARFSATPPQPPDAWFALASRAGVGIELEVKAVRHALAALDSLPEELWLSLNVSSACLRDPRLHATLADADLGRVVLELTDVDDEPRVLAPLDSLRAQGLRLAVDERGSGYAELGRALRLGPDLLKLDRELVAGLDGDPARRAVVRASVETAHARGIDVVAEGVETEAECAAVLELGVDAVQGHHLARPLAEPWEHLHGRMRLLGGRTRRSTDGSRLRAAGGWLAAGLAALALALALLVLTGAGRPASALAAGPPLVLDLGLATAALATGALLLGCERARRRAREAELEARRRLGHAEAAVWRARLEAQRTR